jgi:transcription initiation factor TFIIIB Brf1 subunit/transcription initiation factor TFIIB
MSSTYSRKSERKLIFTQEILDEARNRIENAESQRKVAASVGTKESTLRNRLKLVSEHY